MYNFNVESMLKSLEVLSSGHRDSPLVRRESIVEGVCTHFGYLFWDTSYTGGVGRPSTSGEREPVGAG